MTESELAALRQRAERAAQKGGVVAVDARVLLRLLDIGDALTCSTEGAVFMVEVYINRMWRTLFGPSDTFEAALDQAHEIMNDPVRIVKLHKEVVHWVASLQTTAKEIVKVYEGK